MRFIKFGVVLLAVLMLLGCNAIKKLDKSDAYLKAKLYDRPLVLPKDLNEGYIENHYPVPKAASNRWSGNVSILPPGSKIKD